ncbi:hypothetical protein AAG570_011680, partial [Ranatra chinensis]
RIYWVLAILGVHSAVWLVIGDQLEQFSRSPVVFSMESEPTPVSSIPFPAETHGIEGCRKTVLEIKWQTEKLNEPCDHVQPMATDAGACFTFNMLPLDHVLRRPDSIVSVMLFLIV